MVRITTLALILMLSLASCAGMSPETTETVQRSGAGTLVGAAGGAAIGAIAGNAGMGAAIGAGAGFLGGLIYDQNQKAYDRGRQDAQAGR